MLGNLGTGRSPGVLVSLFTKGDLAYLVLPAPGCEGPEDVPTPLPSLLEDPETYLPWLEAQGLVAHLYEPSKMFCLQEGNIIPAKAL